MAIFTFDLPPDGPDPCPQACGGMTEDPYGGPCKRCWDTVGHHDEEDDDPCAYDCGRIATTPWGTCQTCEDEATGRDENEASVDTEETPASTQCHECHEAVSVSRDGRIHSHYDDDLATCPGSGSPL